MKENYELLAELTQLECDLENEKALVEKLRSEIQIHKNAWVEACKECEIASESAEKLAEALESWDAEKWKLALAEYREKFPKDLLKI